MLVRWSLMMIFLLSASVAGAIEFDRTMHRDHQERLPGLACENCLPLKPCNTCHVEDARNIVPQRAVCHECHDDDFVMAIEFPLPVTHGPTWGLTHRPFAKGSEVNCEACHGQDFCTECHQAGFADEQGAGNALTNVHRGDFQISHPLAARTDSELCSSCHENRFCVDCHDDFAPADLALDSHRRGFSDGTLGGLHATYNEAQCLTCHPGSVLPTHQWSNRHAREARKNLATCQACHPEGDICLTCHSDRSGLGVNPHPDGWGRIENRLKRASGGRTCRKCHPGF